jgi:D-threo-aldose 1-dehydrogenase
VSIDPFERVRLGRAPVDVWRFGVGMAALSGLFREVSDDDAAVVLDHAWDIGVRYYDTAPLYGYGLGERRLGRLLQKHDRATLAVSSKVGRLLYPIAEIEADPSLEPDRPAVDIPGFDPHEGYFKGAPDERPVFDYSYDGVMRSVEASLQRTGLEHIDIFWIHDPDNHWEQAISGAYPALADLRSQGVVSAIGVGMNQAEMLTRFAREGEFDALMCAGRYTLLDQTALYQLFPVCEERGTVIVAASVMNSGLLANPGPDSKFDYAPASQALIDRALAIKAVCEGHGVPLRAAALQFVFGHPLVVSVVAGVRSIAHVDDAVDNLRWPIPDAMWDDLRAEGLLPGEVPTPGEGPTPSATPTPGGGRQD